MRLIIEVPALERHEDQKVTLDGTAAAVDGTLWQHLGF